MELHEDDLMSLMTPDTNDASFFEREFDLDMYSTAR